MRFMGNGITSCYPDEVDNFISITVLKDRKGRAITAEDVVHYQKIIVALNETVRIMAEIDEIIEAHGGWPDAFQATSYASRKPRTLAKVAESSRPYGADEDRRAHSRFPGHALTPTGVMAIRCKQFHLPDL